VPLLIAKGREKMPDAEITAGDMPATEVADAGVAGSDLHVSGVESAQAKQAKTEALEHARKARAAAARYARLVPEPNGNAASIQRDPDDAEAERRAGRTEVALAATVVSGQVQRLLLGDQSSRLHRVLGASLSWVPLMFLNPVRRRGGVIGFLSDPRVWSAGVIALATVAKEMQEVGGEMGAAKGDRERGNEANCE
jgi:hypothetical protein